MTPALDPGLPTDARIITRTPRLVLRTWTAADVEPIARVWSDAETMRYAGATPIERIPAALRAGLAAQAAHGVCLWAVELPGRGVIGDCGFHHRPDGLELGYHLDPRFWGRGYATEAARGAITYAIESLGARRIVAWVASANPRSGAVLDRLGFTGEGPDPDEDDELRYTLTVGA